MRSDQSIAVSVIIPAWNEAQLIAKTLQNLQQVLAELDVNSEIIVADNDSTDETAAIATGMGARVVHESERHIARARNTGAGIARGQMLFFVDADTWPAAEHFQKAVALLQSGEICGGGAAIEFDGLNRGPHRVGVSMWNRISVRFNVAAGCFFFCTREAFDAVGGFSVKHYAGEEVYFSHSLKRWGKKHGKRFQVIPSPLVQTSGRKVEWFKPWEHFIVILMVMLFPFVLRSRRLSWFWYKRPQSAQSSTPE